MAEGRVVGQENNELFDVKWGRKKSLTFFSERNFFLPRVESADLLFYPDFYDTYSIPHDADGLGENV